MDVEINLIAVGLATVSSFVVGMIWYMPSVLGETWRNLIGMDKKTMDKGPKPRAWVFTVTAAFLQAYVLAYVTYLAFTVLGNSWMESALLTAFWMWTGFQLSLLLTHDSFEQRRLKLTAINAGNQLITLGVMGLIIGLFEL
jgi:hypothetical protein